jgi:tetratricopeptide (TPR) repeat protein
MDSKYSKLQNNNVDVSGVGNKKQRVQLVQLPNGSNVGGVSLKYIMELSKQLKPHATMNDFVHEIIKPATLTKQESYLELLAREQPHQVKSTADHFTSYVWAYEVVDELLASLKYTLLDKTKDKDVFIWLDTFCVNQHQLLSLGERSTPEQLQQIFYECFKTINSFVMVLSNWQDPEYAKRSWCVFETYMAKKAGIKNTILAMSEKEEKRLVKAMIGNEIRDEFLQQLFSSVDVESAKAKEPADQEAILQIIRKFGVSEVNAVILGNLKQWMVQGGDIALKSVQVDSKEAGSICVARRFIHDALGEYDVALEWAEKALNNRIKVYGAEHQNVATAYTNKAASLQILGRLGEALVANEQAFTIYTKVLGVDHPNTINSRSWKAGILQTQGKLEEALVIHSEVLESSKRVLGEDHIDTVGAMSYKGGCLLYLKRHDEALPLYNQAITITKRTLGENHPDLAAYLNNKALCLQEMGRPEEALPMYDQVMGIYTKVYGADHPQVALSLVNKAGCLDSLKRYNEALTLYDQSLTIYLNTYGNEHAEVGRVLHFKAVCLKNLGREKEAMELGKQVIGIYERTLGHDHYRTVNARELWGT